MLVRGTPRMARQQRRPDLIRKMIQRGQADPEGLARLPGIGRQRQHCVQAAGNFHADLADRAALRLRDLNMSGGIEAATRVPAPVKLSR